MGPRLGDLPSSDHGLGSGLIPNLRVVTMQPPYQDAVLPPDSKGPGSCWLRQGLGSGGGVASSQDGFFLPT